MTIQPHTIGADGDNPLTIYAETENINYFLAVALEPDTVDGPVNKSAAVTATTRRQYPGDDTTISVSGSTKEFVVDPSRKSGNALPGKSFVLKERGGLEELRRFTYKGRMIDLHAFLSANTAKMVYLYGNSGARYTINLPGAV